MDGNAAANRVDDVRHILERLRYELSTYRNVSRFDPLNFANGQRMATINPPPSRIEGCYYDNANRRFDDHPGHWSGHGEYGTTDVQNYGITLTQNWNSVAEIPTIVDDEQIDVETIGNETEDPKESVENEGISDKKEQSSADARNAEVDDTIQTVKQSGDTSDECVSICSTIGDDEIEQIDVVNVDSEHQEPSEYLHLVRAINKRSTNKAAIIEIVKSLKANPNLHFDIFPLVVKYYNSVYNIGEQSASNKIKLMKILHYIEWVRRETNGVMDNQCLDCLTKDPPPDNTPQLQNNMYDVPEVLPAVQEEKRKHRKNKGKKPSVDVQSPPRRSKRVKRKMSNRTENSEKLNKSLKRNNLNEYSDLTEISGSPKRSRNPVSSWGSPTNNSGDTSLNENSLSVKLRKESNECIEKNTDKNNSGRSNTSSKDINNKQKSMETREKSKDEDQSEDKKESIDSSIYPYTCPVCGKSIFKKGFFKFHVIECQAEMMFKKKIIESLYTNTCLICERKYLKDHRCSCLTFSKKI